MPHFWDDFNYSFAPPTDKDCIIRKNGVRFSVLTPYLVRTEIQTGSVFCDCPTQCVINRSFDTPRFTAEAISDGALLIKTEACKFAFDFNAKKMLYIILDDGRKVTDYQAGNLKGTCRTLDGTVGKTKLNNGVLSKNGVAVLDDSASLVVDNKGNISPRKASATDLYYFAYGYHYEEALKAYFNLTGFPPLIPRFALGNWWSRYKAYTQDEYMRLMEKFEEKKIPITVATIDMDWHWVKVTEKFGKEAADKKESRGIVELFYNLTNPGWTGYSWNTDLFPDHKTFLLWLKEHNYKITLNLHPASGCKFYEDAYADFCDFMGLDKTKKQQIHFDITDKKFMEGYFRFLHHPQEDDGVDFWWIDWQQGTKSKTPGLDPLWALNHYHYLDNARNNKRPLILSRFAGAGSHRYPLGFSGDTAQSWSVLAFQPYFTSTASNIGYSWWSHDIGGHHFGERDDELYLRWVQFGVFSPVMRLHSTSNEFMGKEPWKYRADIELFATRAMKFRHRLLPYLYTMNHLAASEGTPLIRPMYYLYPNDERAYSVPNQYAFGTQLLVCPITEKTNPATGLAGTKAFLPEGRYTDIFTGRAYRGNCETVLYRDESTIPVLAKEGAIIPLSVNDTQNDSSNPSEMELMIYYGDGEFRLYEDDGVTNDYKNGAFCETPIKCFVEETSICVEISKPEGDVGVIPQKRNYVISLMDIASCGGIDLKKNGVDYTHTIQNTDGHIAVCVNDITPDDKIEIRLKQIARVKNETIKELKTALISKLQGSNNAKARFNRLLADDKSNTAHPALKGPIGELFALDYSDT